MSNWRTQWEGRYPNGLYRMSDAERQRRYRKRLKDKHNKEQSEHREASTELDVRQRLHWQRTPAPITNRKSDNFISLAPALLLCGS